MHVLEAGLTVPGRLFAAALFGLSGLIPGFGSDLSCAGAQLATCAR